MRYRILVVTSCGATRNTGARLRRLTAEEATFDRTETCNAASRPGPNRVAHHQPSWSGSSYAITLASVLATRGPKRDRERRRIVGEAVLQYERKKNCCDSTPCPRSLDSISVADAYDASPRDGCFYSAVVRTRTLYPSASWRSTLDALRVEECDTEGLVNSSLAGPLQDAMRQTSEMSHYKSRKAMMHYTRICCVMRDHSTEG
jgi:hypothetical protein